MYKIIKSIFGVNKEGEGGPKHYLERIKNIDFKGDNKKLKEFINRYKIVHDFILIYNKINNNNESIHYDTPFGKISDDDLNYRIEQILNFTTDKFRNFDINDNSISSLYKEFIENIKNNREKIIEDIQNGYIPRNQREIIYDKLLYLSNKGYFVNKYKDDDKNVLKEEVDNDIENIKSRGNTAYYKTPKEIIDNIEGMNFSNNFQKEILLYFKNPHTTTQLVYHLNKGKYNKSIHMNLKNDPYFIRLIDGEKIFNVLKNSKNAKEITQRQILSYFVKILKEYKNIGYVTLLEKIQKKYGYTIKILDNFIIEVINELRDNNIVKFYSNELYGEYENIQKIVNDLVEDKLLEKGGGKRLKTDSTNKYVLLVSKDIVDLLNRSNDEDLKSILQNLRKYDPSLNKLRSNGEQNTNPINFLEFFKFLKKANSEKAFKFVNTPLPGQIPKYYFIDNFNIAVDSLGVNKSWSVKKIGESFYIVIE